MDCRICHRGVASVELWGGVVVYTWKRDERSDSGGSYLFGCCGCVKSAKRSFCPERQPSVAVIVLRPLVIAVSALRHITQYNTY